MRLTLEVGGALTVMQTTVWDRFGSGTLLVGYKLE